MKFVIDTTLRESIDNYDLFLKPNGIFYSKSLSANNYLYPCYYYKKDDIYISSTSVFELIKHKKTLKRNHKFTTNHFYRPSFSTIDLDIRRYSTRTVSSFELNNPKMIMHLGVKLMQEYITEIEKLFPNHINLLLMGGKDSQNILLCNRNTEWAVLSGEPNTNNSIEFIDKNNLKITEFLSGNAETDNTFFNEEIIYSDCLFGPSHIRWMSQIKKFVEKNDGKVILWMGTNGDGIFAKNNNHRDNDYFAVQDLHVGTAMGVLHQVYKNFLNIPVLSPYQSPKMIKDLICKFNPYYIEKSGDIRELMGNLLLGKQVYYPNTNPTPPEYIRQRTKEISIYINHLKNYDVKINSSFIKSHSFNYYDKFLRFLDKHSNKKRTFLSKALFPLRNILGRSFPTIRNYRHDIKKLEIK